MNYANIKYNDIANGEGIRVSLFVSGCTHHCKNCFNKVAWDFNYGNEFTVDIENKILKAMEPEHINGLTLLGGEPMEPANQKGLLNFVKKVKQTYPNKTIWCYSGYLFDEELLKPSRAHCSWTRELISYFDIMVDGKFVEELKDITLRFKGSSNQRVIDVQKSLKENKVVLSPYNDKKSNEFHQII